MMGRWRRASAVYVIQVGVLCAVYGLLLAVSLHLLGAHPRTPWRELIALIPVVPIAGIALAYLRVLRHLDELERRIQMQALAFSFWVTALLALTYGFLQDAGLPPLSPWWIWVVMLGLWAAGVLVQNWRYR
jgi:hypothetical protein